MQKRITKRAWPLKTKRNIKKAAEWFRKAANQGHGGGMHRLAYLLEEDGNNEEAYIWFKEACIYGEEFACYRVGTALKYGKGVTKDGYEAVKIFRKGIRTDKKKYELFYLKELSHSYLTGTGVIRDKILAHMWMNIAAAKGFVLHMPGIPVRGKGTAAEARDRLEKSMSPADISEATKRAKRCLKSRYKYCNY
jgi:TPR repeat protein